MDKAEDHKKESHLVDMTEDEKKGCILHITDDHNTGDSQHKAEAQKKNDSVHKDEICKNNDFLQKDQKKDDTLLITEDFQMGEYQKNDLMRIVGDFELKGTHKNRGYLKLAGDQKKGYLGSSSASKQTENIVLVGRTGNGKSATGNSLIGKKVFESKAHASGVTKECQTHGALTGDGHTLNVIDTPGLFDLSAATDFISKEIVKCLTLAEGGLHAVVLVLSARNRITLEEESTLNTLQVIFGSQIIDYVIVVFTGGDVLEEDSETLEEYLGRDCPDFIKEVIKMSGNRMVLFDNKTHDENKKAEQVHRLLFLVDGIRRSKHGEAYTDDTYHMIKEETDKLRKQQEELESKNYSEESVAEMKNQLCISYEENLKRMSEMMEKKLKDAAEKQQKALSKLQAETNELDLEIKIHIPLPPMAWLSSCNIL